MEFGMCEERSVSFLFLQRSAMIGMNKIITVAVRYLYNDNCTTT